MGFLESFGLNFLILVLIARFDNISVTENKVYVIYRKNKFVIKI